MRRATARDEIDVLEHPLARRNDAYRDLVRLSRTIVSIGGITEITPAVVENLLAADFHHLLRQYDTLNGPPEAPEDEVRRDDEAPDGAPREDAPRSGETPTSGPDLSDLQLSEDATRWMIEGDLPDDLVPMPGSPSSPSTDAPGPARTSGPVVARVTEARRGDAWQNTEQPSRLRLARTPPAGLDRARQLAALAGGELSASGALSTVTFPSARSTDEASPVAEPAGGAMSQRDMDELYELFLRRLRRDLLHDRERAGDVPGQAP